MTTERVNVIEIQLAQTVGDTVQGHCCCAVEGYGFVENYFRSKLAFITFGSMVLAPGVSTGGDQD